ncbi:MAG: hypothetical protein IPN76_10385 [Saprospiraceae bacterium]|nr:hypothetical protein [Saprospiraceae bacterium]
MFLEKVMMVNKIITDLGCGLRYLFITLYGKQTLLELKFPSFRFPIYIRNKTSDVPTFNACILDEGYNFNLGFEPETVVDLGSNIGLSAVYFATRYPTAKIICVEPEQDNYDLLVKNTKHLQM